MGGVAARLDLARESLLMARVPTGAITGMVTLEVNGYESNGIAFEVGARIAQNLHPVANPAIDAAGNLYVTLSGSRGQKVPVSVYKISPRGILTPFAHDIVNPTGMAFGPAGEIYISSRFDGQVYRVTAEGTSSVFARVWGWRLELPSTLRDISTSGIGMEPIHRINQQGMGTIFATLAPSVAAFHLAFDSRGIYT